MASIISILVLTLLFLTINPISSNLVDDVCDNFPKDLLFCYNVFYRDESATDMQELAQSIIDQTYSQAAPTIKQIEFLLPQTNDAQLKQVYTLCKNYFTTALTSLSAANAKLKSHDYRYVKMAVNAFSRDVASCRKTFSLAPSKRIEILDYVDSVEHYLGILVVAVGKL